MRIILATACFWVGACAAPAGQDSAEPGTQVSLQSAAFETESSETMPESPPEPENPAKKPDQPIFKETPDGIAGLPASDGKTFSSLDEYLAHLEVKGHTDRPFWERMKDGRYRWNTGRGMQFTEPKYATRDELLEKYGFSE